MEEQNQIVAHKNIRFNKKSFIDDILCGKKCGTFRSNRNNKYTAGAPAVILYEETDKHLIRIHKVATVVIKSVVKVQILTDIDSLLIENRTIISTIHDNTVLEIIAKADGFDSWQNMKSYFGENFRGSWILFDMDSIKVEATWSLHN
jgi:uncharacterized protein YqfB (UPF0267 family)